MDIEEKERLIGLLINDREFKHSAIASAFAWLIMDKPTEAKEVLNGALKAHNESELTTGKMTPPTSNEER